MISHSKLYTFCHLTQNIYFSVQSNIGKASWRSPSLLSHDLKFRQWFYPSATYLRGYWKGSENGRVVTIGGNHFNPIRSTSCVVDFPLRTTRRFFRMVCTPQHWCHVISPYLQSVPSESDCKQGRKGDIWSSGGHWLDKGNLKPFLTNCYTIGAPACFLLRERNETFFSPGTFIYVTTLVPV